MTVVNWYKLILYKSAYFLRFEIYFYMLLITILWEDQLIQKIYNSIITSVLKTFIAALCLKYNHAL